MTKGSETTLMEAVKERYQFLDLNEASSIDGGSDGIDYNRRAQHARAFRRKRQCMIPHW
jgi:hypothetical protein